MYENIAVETNRTVNKAIIPVGNSGICGVGEGDLDEDAVGRSVGVGVLWTGEGVDVGFTMGCCVGVGASVGEGVGVGTSVGDGEGVGDGVGEGLVGVGEGAMLVHVQVIVEGALIVNVVTDAPPEAGTLPVPIQPEQ